MVVAAGGGEEGVRPFVHCCHAYGVLVSGFQHRLWYWQQYHTHFGNPWHACHTTFWEVQAFCQYSDPHSTCRWTCKSDLTGCILHQTFICRLLWFDKCSLWDVLLLSWWMSHQQQGAWARIVCLQAASSWCCCGVCRPFWHGAPSLVHYIFLELLIVFLIGLLCRLPEYLVIA